MPKLNDATKAKRRDHIIAAATACFARKGFHDTTMRDIFEEAGVSTGAVYNYFASKLDLLKAICDNSKVSNAEMYAAAEAEVEAGPIEAIFCRAFAVNLEKTEGIEKASMNLDVILEAHRNAEVRPLIHEVWQQAFDRMERVVRKGQEQGEVSASVEPRTLANLLLAQYMGTLALRLVDPELDTGAMIDLQWQAIFNSDASNESRRETP